MEDQGNTRPGTSKDEPVAEHSPTRAITFDSKSSDVASDNTKTSGRKERRTEDVEAPDSSRPNSGRAKRTTWAPLPEKKDRRRGSRFSFLRDHRSCCMVFALVSMLIFTAVLMYCIIMMPQSNIPDIPIPALKNRTSPVPPDGVL